MQHKITLKLGAGWEITEESYIEQDGSEVTHVECHLPNDAKQTDEALIDMYVGDMPADTTAQDEALANYADIIGWEDDEDEDPIIEWPFAGKKAYGFEALCEDDSPMRIMCCEIKKGVLLIMNVVGANDERLVDTIQQLERTIRIDKAE